MAAFRPAKDTRDVKVRGKRCRADCRVVQLEFQVAHASVEETLASADRDTEHDDLARGEKALVVGGLGSLGLGRAHGARLGAVQKGVAE